MTFLQKINDFITELQKKDDQAKKQWLISSTAISMTLVLILWGFYFSATIQNLNKKASVQKNSGGFGATFNQGLKVITDKIGLQVSKTMESAQNYVKATNSVTIQPTNLEISTGVEPITPNKFP